MPGNKFANNFSESTSPVHQSSPVIIDGLQVHLVRFFMGGGARGRAIRHPESGFAPLRWAMINSAQDSLDTRLAHTHTLNFDFLPLKLFSLLVRNNSMHYESMNTIYVVRTLLKPHSHTPTFWIEGCPKLLTLHNSSARTRAAFSSFMENMTEKSCSSSFSVGM